MSIRRLNRAYGQYVYIMLGIRIGKGAMVGAGAAVTRNLPPHAICAGSPLRNIRYSGG
jgi:acetyltransferase-like isoleucine patch superfamily enzyme